LVASLVVLVGACSSGGGQRALVREAGRPATTTTAAAPPSTTTTTATTVAATAAPQPAGCPPIPARAAPPADRPRYVLDFSVDFPQAVVAGTVEVRFTPDLATDRLVFRLWPNAPVVAAGGGHLDTGAVTVDGRAVPAGLANPTTLVVQTGAIAAGQTVDARLPWRLALPGAVNDRVARMGQAVRLGSFFPILPWEPGVGWDTEPPTTQFAEASTAPTADFDVTVATNPPDMNVLASGAQDRPGHWTATAMRDFALSVAHFNVVTAVAHAPGPVTVTVGVAAGMADNPQTYAAKAVNVLAQHSARFGPYAWPTYTLALTPNLSGGIEYPSFVMQGPNTIGRTTSHELGHQWFYGLVGNDQGRDPWLDEGLATYAEGRYEGTIDSMRTRAIPGGAAGHLGEPMTYWSGNKGVYNLGVYIQGAKALASLGPYDLVDCGLRVYVARNAYRIARQADLVGSLAAVFPQAPSTLAGFGVRT
jgi:hypothetical protein